MLRLKTILHSNYFYILLFLLLIIYCFFYYSYTRDTNIDLNSDSFTGIITNYKIDKDLLTLEVKGKEKIVGYYYFKSLEEANSFGSKYKLGDKVLLNGSFSIPKNNTVPNLFNYKNYLKYKHIYLTINISSISKIKDNKT